MTLPSLVLSAPSLALKEENRSRKTDSALTIRVEKKNEQADIGARGVHEPKGWTGSKTRSEALMRTEATSESRQKKQGFAAARERSNHRRHMENRREN
jgi:uncharacterized protein (DUF2141 family)